MLAKITFTSKTGAVNENSLVSWRIADEQNPFIKNIPTAVWEYGNCNYKGRQKEGRKANFLLWMEQWVLNIVDIQDKRKTLNSLTHYDWTSATY